jgi:Large polyvalent protein associated domain 29
MSPAASASKLIRTALRRDFPRTNFSIRKHTARMCCRYVVTWFGGPSEEEVQQVAKPLIAEVPWGSIYCVRDDGDTA